MYKYEIAITDYNMNSILRKTSFLVIIVWGLYMLADSPLFSQQRTIQFAGHIWNVKSGYGGPGPNNWSNDTQSVWVDSDGALHLKIRKIGDTWYCAEVYSTEYTTYGLHRFYIASKVDDIDKNAVAAVFLYANDTTEIDIEFTKWGVDNPDANAQYVVQPYNAEGNIHTFPMTLSTDSSTHLFDWQPSSIFFRSLHGHCSDPLNTSYNIKEWQYTGSDIPAEDENLRMHINLWLFRGQPPAQGEEIEFIIADADLPESTALEIESEEAIPSSFSLEQNFPNPFNSETFIRYSAEKAGLVNVSIFSISGREVKRLIDGRIVPGNYQAKWDGTNNSGLPVSSGIYLTRLKADKNELFSKKMLFLK